jgi:OOP family OmpA-OmpF porin
LRSVSYPLLLRAARLLNDHPEYIHIEVQGHADARGDSDFNQRLSERRATAVMDFLIERGGVDASRLHASGYGTAQPLVEAQDQRALYLNRRVEFSVTRRPSTETRGSSR